jgi:acyl-CoA dehydrogenase
MVTLLWLIAGLIGLLALMFARTRAMVWLAGIIVWLVAGAAAGVLGIIGFVILAVILAGPALIIALPEVRTKLISRRLLGVFRNIMPQMSETERSAIDAGTVWWDGELFGGSPNWQRLLNTPPAKLSVEEQAFLDHETETLCDLASDWDSTQIWQDLPPKAWDYAKEKGFLGLIIPREYGGKEFSAIAHSAIVMKLATRCSAAAVSVMVPNSLGPAELLLHYGTEEQKNHYLPRLARGEEVPCFALTSPYAGSDAAAIPDTGIVVKRMWQGKETLGFSVTWSKRYITLAPIATVLGLAFNVKDPDHLLGANEAVGITCALIPREHPGVEIGRRHWPLNAVFQNGPTHGKDVFIPIDMVIGGLPQVGNGWRMLMECLAAGRAISLPSSNVGAAKLAVNATGAYCAIRKQFNTPIGMFEGIQEPLGRMGGHLYAMDAVRTLSAAAIDIGEKPSVISAIAKYHVTERARMVVADAMDVIGGKGICMGPGNFLARAYQQIPIAITVEGANIMTRTLIIFGQGAIRCHPYVLKLMHAATNTDQAAGLREFDRAFFAHMNFVVSNVVRSFVHGLTFGAFLPVPAGAAPELAIYYRAAGRLSLLLALSADIAMATLGGALKRKESITGRLGDVLSQLYIISAVLKRFEDDGRPAADLPLVHWAVQDALSRAYEALRGVYGNYPNAAVGGLLRLLSFPLGIPAVAPGDHLHADIAYIMQHQSPTRERLVAGSWHPRLEVDELGSIELAFEAYPKVEAIEHRVRDAVKSHQIARMPQALPLLLDWADEAVAKNLISDDERETIKHFVLHADKVIQVDDFAPDFDAAKGIATKQDYLKMRHESDVASRVAGEAHKFAAE